MYKTELIFYYDFEQNSKFYTLKTLTYPPITEKT